MDTRRRADHNHAGRAVPIQPACCRAQAHRQQLRITMEIRPATPQDIDAIIALGARMHNESPRFSKLSYNGEKVRNLMAVAMQDQRYLVLVADMGGELLGGF